MGLVRQRIHATAALCRDCQACMLGCSLRADGACGLASARLAVDKDMATYTFAIRVCRHCDSPDCLAACPSGAIALDDRGVAVLSDAECNRCGACRDACGFGAIFWDEARERYLKCDLCAGRADGPICVALCPVGALTTGE